MTPIPTDLLVCKITQGMHSAKKPMEICSFVEMKGRVLKPVVVKQKIAVYPERVGTTGVSPPLALAMNVLSQEMMACAQQMNAQNREEDNNIIVLNTTSFDENLIKID